MLIPSSAPLSARHPFTPTLRPPPLSSPLVRFPELGVFMFCLPFWYFLPISSPFPSIPFHYYLYSPQWMRTYNIILGEISQLEKEKHYMVSFLGNIKNMERDYRRMERKWVEISEGVTEVERLLTLGKEQGVVDGEVGGDWGWLSDGHWGGHLMGWTLGVILYVGKLNTNKK